MTTREMLRGIAVGQWMDWRRYYKAVAKREESPLVLWGARASLGEKIKRTGVWLRENLGYDVVEKVKDKDGNVVKDEEGNEVTVTKHYPCYHLLFASGALEDRSLRGYVVQETGYISERTINLLEQKRVATHAFILNSTPAEEEDGAIDESQRFEYIPPLEMTGAKENDGTGTQTVSD